MSEALLKTVQDRLTMDQWTRATLSNYSISQFKELDAILKEAREERAYDELKALCDEHLVHTHNKSIVGLYLSGMIAISRQLIDDAEMTLLMNTFVDNHKWPVVRFLCDRILEYGESRFALRTLADCCKNENDEEGVYAIWERLVKVDYEEADLAKALAEYRERESRFDEAVDYYKKALHRYINKGLFTNVREIWTKLLEFCGEDTDFFLLMEKKVAKNISEDKAQVLLEDLYNACRGRGDINTAIAVLKLILQYDEKDPHARREIIDCFKTRYADHSQLDEYIKVSNLSQNWRNVHEAVTDFEKHIAFDKGNFVRHREWGVGRIAKVEGDEIRIDFARKRGHTMSLKMAVNALQTLSKDHIWVLKATWKKDALHDKVKGEIAWALKTVIKSFGNSCDLKRIKAELVPSVLTAGEWTSWNTKAREILKSDLSFGVNSEKSDLYTVREAPITMDEKLFNEFRAQKNFFDRMDTLRAFVAQKDADLDSDYFTEMFSYFSGYIRSYSQVNEQVVASYLLVKDLVGKNPNLGSGLTLNFLELFEGIEDLPELFGALKEARLKEDFLKHIRLFVPGWTDIYVKIFPRALFPSIIESLEAEGREGEEKLTAMVQHCFEHYRDYREAVVWIYRFLREREWYAATGLTEEKEIITLIHILNLTYREIENHRDTMENRKINKQVHGILFKDGLLASFIAGADEDTVKRIHPLIDDVKDLDPADKLALRARILEKYPDFKFFGDDEKKVSTLGLIVTQAKFLEKQRQLDRILNEDVPANSKELEFAKSLGDLRENAEYKAALEKQSILQATLAKLNEEIGRAQRFDPATVNTGRVSFGTRVVLENLSTGAEEEYTILGPWESDPEKRVISYLSPFGGAILNRKAGETFEFSPERDRKISYTVKTITAVSL